MLYYIKFNEQKLSIHTLLEILVGNIKMSYSCLKLSFETITQNVWDNLEDAYNCNLSFGETTISDMILLHLSKENNPNIRIFQTKQDEESEYGTDWVWWIGSEEKGWIGFAVQAKKYHTKDDRYHSLCHKVKGKAQWEILESHAKSIKAIPIYALYNYALDEKTNICARSLISGNKKNMYGVTVTPLNNVTEALRTRGCRNFNFLHDKSDTIPLPDLISLTREFLNSQSKKTSSNFLESNTIVHKKIPLGLGTESALSFIPNNNLQKDSSLDYFDDSPKRTFARRVLIIDIREPDYGKNKK